MTFDNLEVLINNKPTRTKVAHKNVSSKQLKQNLQKDKVYFSFLLFCLICKYSTHVKIDRNYCFPYPINIKNIKETSLFRAFLFLPIHLTRRKK